MWIIALAFVAEIIDSSLGMMYGTLLAPLLIGLGYAPKMVIPSILLSQAVGGFVASIGHHKYANCNFRGWTCSTKIATSVIVPGLFACFIGALVAVSISPFALKLYIGLLVILMGILCLRPIAYRFNWWVIGGMGLLAGFNKAFSGGGFGPVTSTGKILGGVSPKVSVATTTLAEVPICLASFLFWWLLGNNINWEFTGYLIGGSALGAVVGPYITSRINTKYLKVVVGALAIVAGIWILIKLVGG